MKNFALVLGLIAVVGLSACEGTSATVASGNAYPITHRTAGHDDVVVSKTVRKKATSTFNQSLRK